MPFGHEIAPGIICGGELGCCTKLSIDLPTLQNNPTQLNFDDPRLNDFFTEKQEKILKHLANGESKPIFTPLGIMQFKVVEGNLEVTVIGSQIQKFEINQEKPIQESQFQTERITKNTLNYQKSTPASIEISSNINYTNTREATAPQAENTHHPTELVPIPIVETEEQIIRIIEPNSEKIVKEYKTQVIHKEITEVKTPILNSKISIDDQIPIQEQSDLRAEMQPNEPQVFLETIHPKQSEKSNKNSSVNIHVTDSKNLIDSQFLPSMRTIGTFESSVAEITKTPQSTLENIFDSEIAQVLPQENHNEHDAYLNTTVGFDTQQYFVTNEVHRVENSSEIIEVSVETISHEEKHVENISSEVQVFFELTQKKPSALLQNENTYSSTPDFLIEEEKVEPNVFLHAINEAHGKLTEQNKIVPIGEPLPIIAQKIIDSSITIETDQIQIEAPTHFAFGRDSEATIVFEQPYIHVANPAAENQYEITTTDEQIIIPTAEELLPSPLFVSTTTGFTVDPDEAFIMLQLLLYDWDYFSDE